MPEGPGIISKGLLTTGRIVNKPFQIPKRLETSALTVGAATHNAIGKTSLAIAESMASLDPKGPAKWAVNLLGNRIPTAVGKSAEIAQRNDTVFWKPFGDGMAAVGHAVAGPLAVPYARRAGFPVTGEVIGALLDAPLFLYPTPPPPEAQAQAAPQAAPQEQQAAPQGEAPPQQ